MRLSDVLLMAANTNLRPLREDIVHQGYYNNDGQTTPRNGSLLFRAPNQTSWYQRNQRMYLRWYKQVLFSLFVNFLCLLQYRRY